MKQIKFSISLLFFWIKGVVEVDRNSVKVEVPNTILGIIPLGADRQNIPLRNISSATVSTSYHFLRILIGGGVALIGVFTLFGALATIMSSFVEAVLLLLVAVLIIGLGAGIIATAMQIVLEIRRGGKPYYISVPFYEKGNIQKVSDHINNGLIYEGDKGDLFLQDERRASQN